MKAMEAAEQSAHSNWPALISKNKAAARSQYTDNLSDACHLVGPVMERDCAEGQIN
jgi:hypothetical protein